MKREINKLKTFRKWFDKFIIRNYGKKCREFEWDCPCCRANFVKESFSSFVDNLIDTENWCNKQKPKKKHIKTKYKRLTIRT